MVLMLIYEVSGFESALRAAFYAETSDLESSPPCGWWFAVLPSLAYVLQGGMVFFMVIKCAIFALRAFLARFNAFLLVGVVLLL